MLLPKVLTSELIELGLVYNLKLTLFIDLQMHLYNHGKYQSSYEYAITIGIKVKMTLRIPLVYIP